jgi:hypothetical protein|tara:strand:- start:112 stop:243 length:132 start_codon:yes stop_codon:yes gene_type:complete
LTENNVPTNRSDEEEERIKSIVRALGFFFLAVVFWYAFDIANL